MNVVIFKMRKMNHAQENAGHVSLRSCLRDAGHFQSEFHVLPDVQPGKESQFLKKQNSIRARTFYGAAVHDNFSSSGPVQARDQMQQR